MSPSWGARASCSTASCSEEVGPHPRRVLTSRNVVKCRPPNNRDPAPSEIEACRPYLDEQIELIAPKVIVTLGNFSTKLLLETSRGIRELRGQVFERGHAQLVPTYHPAYVLRAGGEAMAEMRADLVRAKRLMATAAGAP